MSLNCYFFADEAHVRRERQKAREARKSRWWQQKIGSGRCHYCNLEFKPAHLTMDHIVPIARGGQTSPGNVVPCCKNCNQAKGVDTPVDQLFRSEGAPDSNGLDSSGDS